MSKSFKLLSTLCLSSLLLLTACSKEQKQQTRKAPPPLEVNTITVKKEAVPIWARHTGMTKASSSQEVRARVSGVLTKRFVKDGQQVTKGDKLFQIEQDEYKAALDAAKAKKQQDEASLALAKADVNRYKPLVKEGLAPRATLEQYQAIRLSLEAAIAGDVAEINKAQLQLNYTTIKAPISGKVSARRVDVGNLVGQGEATLLTTIVSTNPIYAYFSPSQHEARLFNKYRDSSKPYAFIEVSGSAEQIRLNGFVDFANNSVDPLTSTITMRVNIENKNNEVLPGTFVYINLFINDKYKFLMIPPEVIFNDQHGSYVYLADANNTIKRADITTEYTNKYYVSVTKGLKDDDRVIVSALVKLKAGRKVVPTDVTDTKGIRAILKDNNLIPKKI